MSGSLSPRVSFREYTESDVRPIDVWEQPYPDTWLLLAVTADDDGEPRCGRLLAMAADLEDLQALWTASRQRGVLTMLTYGPPRGPRPEVVVSAT